MMTTATSDFTAARQFMVDGQIRTNKVTDEALIDALSALPREKFVPKDLRARAYIDDDIPLGGGRYMMEPMVIARLLQALQVQGGAAMLVVGATTGYGAALAAKLGASVTAVESDAALLAAARSALMELNAQIPVECIAGPLEGGCPARAPYQMMLIEGAVEQVPQTLVDQLAEGGRLATVRVQDGIGRAILYTKTGGTLSPRILFDANVRILPGFATPRGFNF